MENTILEMRDITKSFPGVNALENVNLKVRQGEIHALVGENGAGKSTLMKVLSGVYPAGSYNGDILYEGEVRQFKTIKDTPLQMALPRSDELGRYGHREVRLRSKVEEGRQAGPSDRYCTALIKSLIFTACGPSSVASLSR